MRLAFFAVAAALTFCAWVSPSSSQTLQAYRHLILDGHSLKWGEPVLGTGATVTFALADTKRDFVNARNCGSMAPLDELLSRNRIAPSLFRHELDRALAAWEAVANIKFVPADPAVADVLIGAQAEPVGYAFANVDYDNTPSPSELRSISQSLICFNPFKRWKIGFDGNLDVYDLRYVLMHEIGHAIGLNHPLKPGQLMTHTYEEKFRELQPGDIRGVASLYGPPNAAPRIKVGAASPRQVTLR